MASTEKRGKKNKNEIPKSIEKYMSSIQIEIVSALAIKLITKMNLTK